MPPRVPSLGQAVKALEKHYGSPRPPPTRDAFELILWENVAYLASPERRREAFAQLKRTVGTEPAALLAADDEALLGITARGILKVTFAAKLRECAGIALEKFDGDLGPVVRGPLDRAKRALRLFPGIGEPGAEKILLFTGCHALLAPESNGLRVLVRLGLVREEKSYARMYAASREVGTTLGSNPRVVQRAHLLLQLHGRTLCKRAAPLCDPCPLEPDCAYARGLAKPARRRTKAVARKRPRD